MRNMNIPPELPSNNIVREKKKLPELSSDEVIKLVTDGCGETSQQHFGPAESDDLVVILPMATQELYTMLYWGQCHPSNRDEQLFQGMGHGFMSNNKRTIVISHFLPIYAAERTPVSACITNGTYDSIMERIAYERSVYNRNEKKCNKTADGFEYDPFVDRYGLSEPYLYGHTHPGLGCFFSPPDRSSGFATPSLPAVTFVADPFRKDMKAGVGIELKDAGIIAFAYDSANIKSHTMVECNETVSNVVSGENEAEYLITEIGRDCTKLLGVSCAVKGNYKLYRSITGKVKIKARYSWKASDLKTNNNGNDTSRSYESYA